MDIQGLNRDRYLINNPIWVEITDVPQDAVYVELSIFKETPEAELEESQGPQLSLRLHPINGFICFDIGEGVKTYMDLPNWRSETGSGARIETNYQRLRFSFKAVSFDMTTLEEELISRMFIRGGRDSLSDNVVLGSNAVLKESTLLPRWGTFPVRKFSLDDQGAIISTSTIPTDESVTLRIPGCNPVYFKFLNTLGGYSYWLFEVWDFEKSAKREQIVKEKRDYYSLGTRSEYQLSVEGRVERDYFRTMRALADSPEIYVLNVDGKLFRDIIAESFATRESGWYRVFGDRNKFESTSQETLQDVKMKFDVKSKRTSTLLW